MLNLSRIIYTFSFTALIAVLCNSSIAQDQTRFVLKLNDDLVGSFKSYRSLRSNVPPEFEGKISFVELQFQGASTDDPVELDLGLTVSENSASIKMDDKTIETLRQQPIRVAVAEESASFSQIALLYDTPPVTVDPSPAVASTDVAQTEPTPAPGKSVFDPKPTPNLPTDSQHYIRLNDEQAMAGTLDGLDAFEMTTQFGMASIPMKEVAGIKFHTDQQNAAIVVLHNGDSITGTPTVAIVKLLTDWGQADIDAKSISSLTTSAQASFAQEQTEFGSRWILKRDSGKAPSTAGIGNFK